MRARRPAGRTCASATDCSVCSRRAAPDALPRDAGEARRSRATRIAFESCSASKSPCSSAGSPGRTATRPPSSSTARWTPTSPPCRSRSPAPRSACSATSSATCSATARWRACSRATSAAARRPSRRAALAVAVANGYQGALMAPTEILAEQHYRTLTTLLRRQLEVGRTAAGRAADRLAHSAATKREVAEGGGVRRDRRRRRHARADPGRRRVPASSGSPWSTSSTASASCSAPPCASASSTTRTRPDDAAPPRHVGDADPAHARPDLLRRPRRVGDRRDAARPQARSSTTLGRRRTSAAAPTASCATRSTQGARPSSSAR